MVIILKSSGTGLALFRRGRSDARLLQWRYGYKVERVRRIANASTIRFETTLSGSNRDRGLIAERLEGANLPPPRSSAANACSYGSRVPSERYRLRTDGVITGRS
jgi:hypothetical protein